MRRPSKFYTHNGKTMYLNAWSRETGIPKQALYYRVCVKGLSIDEAIALGIPEPPKRYWYNGELHTLSYYADLFDIRKDTLKYWLNKGYTVEQTVEKLNSWSARPKFIPKGCVYPDCERCQFSDCIAP